MASDSHRLLEAEVSDWKICTLASTRWIEGAFATDVACGLSFDSKYASAVGGDVLDRGVVSCDESLKRLDLPEFALADLEDAVVTPPILGIIGPFKGVT